MRFACVCVCDGRSVRSLSRVVCLPLIRANPEGSPNAKSWDLVIRIVASFETLNDLPSVECDSCDLAIA